MFKRMFKGMFKRMFKRKFGPQELASGLGRTALPLEILHLEREAESSPSHRAKP